ncbi:MAG: DUF1852 domain-containing protein [Verrucomicrobiales bacterium]|nr:DUF1852 domain-containing protein [Verrucomicrobiales bacterium]
MSIIEASDRCNPELEAALNDVGFRFELTRFDYDEDYSPSPESRATTNFANLARSTHRQANLVLLFEMINNRLNELMRSSGAGQGSSSYQIRLRIVNVRASFDGDSSFPLSEMLQADVMNEATGECHEGAFGLNLSSYVRDFDFIRLLPGLINPLAPSDAFRNFGNLHGLLYKLQFKDYWAGGVIPRPAVTAISVSSNRHYKRTEDVHPILGERYIELPNESPTTAYFDKMGLSPAFYLPQGNQAPMAVYMRDADPSRFTSIELVTLIAVMDTFQRIYRPEIYNLHERAGSLFYPSLEESDYQISPIVYDRDERNDLAKQQADKVQVEFLEPYSAELNSLLEALNR